MSTRDPRARATRREWLGLLAIALPCAVYAMDMTVLNLALPALSAELKPSGSQLLWIVDVYGFLVAGLLIAMGTLGDRFGRRRLLLIGAGAFALASALAAFVHSAEALIALRALMGVAGATVAPSTLSLIRNMFHDERERGVAVGLWISSYSVGAAIGPLVGGAVLQWFHWSAVFLLAVPVMTLLLVVGPWLLPEYRDPSARPVDAPSVVLSLAAVLASIYGIKRLAEHGADASALGALAAGVVLGAVFARRQRRLADPLLDLGLFARPRFRAAVTAYALASLAMMGVYVFEMQYLQGVLGLTPLAAGVATLPFALGFVAGSMTGPVLAQRFGAQRVMAAGLALAALGLLPVLAVDREVGLAAIVGSCVVVSLGVAPVMAVGNAMILAAAPPERAGAAAAISETSAEFSAAAGIAVFGSLGMALYRAHLAPLLPSVLAGAGRDEALGTLGGAMALAQRLPGPAHDALAAGAGEAFVVALHAAAVAGIAVLTVGTLLAAHMLRAAPPGTRPG